MSEERQAVEGARNGNGRRLDFEKAVLRRYERAAREPEVGLCVPVIYNRSLLEVIPEEI